MGLVTQKQPIALGELTPVMKTSTATFFDIGDGIAYLALESWSDLIFSATRDFVLEALDIVAKRFNGVVFAGLRGNFSKATDWKFVGNYIESVDFRRVERHIAGIQDMHQLLKSFEKPIVAALRGQVFGSGLETAMHCHRRVAIDTAKMGFPDVEAGFLPAGGGLKEAAISVASARHEDERLDLLILEIEKILLRKISTNAGEAKRLGYLRSHDIVIDAKGQLLSRAKETCLQMKGERQTPTEAVYTLPGRSAFGILAQHIQHLLERGAINAYDKGIGTLAALVLTGGISRESYVMSEQEMLHAERQAFARLVRNPETHKRMPVSHSGKDNDIHGKTG